MNNLQVSAGVHCTDNVSENENSGSGSPRNHNETAERKISDQVFDTSEKKRHDSNTEEQKIVKGGTDQVS